MLPKVQVTILARDREKELPMFLKCVESIDYDPKALLIYIHTNNNIDNTAQVLEEWVSDNSNKYADIVYINDHYSELEGKKIRTSEADWYEDGGVRLRVIGDIRDRSLQHSVEKGCDFYFCCDVDNFFTPDTVRYLVKQNRPIIGPMMVRASGSYPNSFYTKISDTGYFKHSPYDKLIYNRDIEGVIKVPLVHICYMVRCNEVHKGLSPQTDGVQMEFIHFARSARDNGIQMYVTNEIQGLMDPTPAFEHNVNICRNLKYSFV